MLKPWKTGLFVVGCLLLAFEVIGAFLGGNRLFLAFGGMIPLCILVWFQFEDELTPARLSAASALMIVSAILLYSGIVDPWMKQCEAPKPRVEAAPLAMPYAVRICRSGGAL
jgi:hypothetical protein